MCGFNNYFGINEEYDTVNKTMYFQNLKEVKDYCKEIVCFYTENDPYVTYEASYEFACTISSLKVNLPDAGHINSESGYNSFLEIVNYLD